ncbi:MAG: glycerol-3-phosphate 1-O-acyltransferase PlsY [Candidatus Omnitrophica bacterium]|nr:glycerol-3-phosphate 1-O-acyltransferase PlsY [Candidatus Omnitrophota bacterium]MDE2008635.1 glycerol-3-phosphate 1-O-acyltransferase PlsY [Candidatus Omnitrophota bacterium]MDE2214982.1 glycerol-3-phosphate 1-O-acyltransferase PlsY [Candidatus Omnitrophota bacterium]MDE2230921.1 glycerol-3-phosphate 1-O-acyltransferase PlsY [Candidatus Omnitrophota bacterium]
MNPLFLAVNVVLAYLIGSIPVAYIFGRVLKKIDIREHGSGNMGATNAFRVLGKGPGTAVLLLDIIKGIIPVTLLADAFGLNDPVSLVLIAVAAVAGHNWTVFLGFKGGKGMATSLGVLTGLAVQLPGLRIILGLATLIWAVIFLASGFVSLASITAAVALPVLMVVFEAPFVLKLLAIILCILIVFRHRPNIRRLVKGQENRVSLFRPKT